MLVVSRVTPNAAHDAVDLQRGGGIFLVKQDDQYTNFCVLFFQRIVFCILIL